MQPARGETTGRREEQGGVERLANAVSAGLHAILGVALLIVVAINVVNATGRYVLGLSMTGADELMVFTMVWVVMAGAVLALAHRDHISVNLLPSYAKGRWRHLLHAVHDAVAMLACAYGTYASWLFVGKIARLGTTSMGLGIPMVVPHTALLIGFAGLTMVGAIMLARDLAALLAGRSHARIPE